MPEHPAGMQKALGLTSNAKEDKDLGGKEEGGTRKRTLSTSQAHTDPQHTTTTSLPAKYTQQPFSACGQSEQLARMECPQGTCSDPQLQWPHLVSPTLCGRYLDDGTF